MFNAIVIEAYPILLIGLVLVVMAAGCVAWRVNSLYFGLTWLGFFYVFSSTLGGFSHAAFTGASIGWFSPLHEEVVQYSIFGTLSMIAGIGIGWRCWLPREQQRMRHPRWVNAQFGLFLFVIGVFATGALVLLREVPTLSTGLHLLTRFREFGLLVLLIDSLVRRSWTVTIVALVVYVPITLAAALASGHTPAKADLLIPAACILAGWRGIRLQTFITLGVSAFCCYCLFVGWMQSRGKIRSGEMESLSFAEAIGQLIDDLVTNTRGATLDSDVANERIRERIDMTNILAKQVSYQPETQPFVAGKTFVEAGIALIPRAIWPGKPEIAGGSLFVERFTGIRRAADDTTSVGLPYPFELYANGGATWVIAGLFVIGFILARLEVFCRHQKLSLGNRLGLFSILLTLAAGGQRMDVVIPSIVAGGLAAWSLGIALEKFMPDLASSLQGNLRNNRQRSARRRPLRDGARKPGLRSARR